MVSTCGICIIKKNESKFNNTLLQGVNNKEGLLGIYVMFLGNRQYMTEVTIFNKIYYH